MCIRDSLGGLELVVDLVEALLEVPNADERTARHAGLDVVAVRDEEELADRPLVQLPVVHDHPALALDRL
eukprot:13160158-Alexandrium_andersonii.AAC.1